MPGRAGGEMAPEATGWAVGGLGILKSGSPADEGAPGADGS